MLFSCHSNPSDGALPCRETVARFARCQSGSYQACRHFQVHDQWAVCCWRNYETRFRGRTQCKSTPTLQHTYCWRSYYARGSRGTNHLEASPRVVLAPSTCKEQRFVEKDIEQMETDTTMQWSKGRYGRRALPPADEWTFSELIYSLYGWRDHRLDALLH